MFCVLEHNRQFSGHGRVKTIWLVLLVLMKKKIQRQPKSGLFIIIRKIEADDHLKERQRFAHIETIYWFLSISSCDQCETSV